MALYKIHFRNSEKYIKVEDSETDEERSVAGVPSLLTSTSVVRIKGNNSIVFLRPVDVLAVEVITKDETISMESIPQLPDMLNDFETDLEEKETDVSVLVDNESKEETEEERIEESSDKTETESIELDIDKEKPRKKVGRPRKNTPPDQDQYSTKVDFSENSPKEIPIPNDILEEISKINSSESEEI
jgi:hypothetical protein